MDFYTLVDAQKKLQLDLTTLYNKFKEILPKQRGDTASETCIELDDLWTQIRVNHVRLQSLNVDGDHDHRTYFKTNTMSGIAAVAQALRKLMDPSFVPTLQNSSKRLCL